MVGAAYGVGLIALRKKDWSSQVYYGPFLALGAAAWIFGGERIIEWWFGLWGWAARLATG
jgi:prepilin signal peptidase PulO-like enzyme (type II secretory pathway)